MSKNMDVCRICLATDVRMFTIANSPVQHVYEKLANTPLDSEGDSKPVVACSMCYTQLRQCHEMIKTSHQAEEILTEILCHYPGVLTKRDEMLDRKNKNLYLQLKTTPVEYFDSSSFNNPIFIKDETEIKETDFKVTKESVENKRQISAICRINFMSNVLMVTIVNTPLQYVYETLTDHLLQADKRPVTVCFICCARLKKFRNFMLRALKAEEFLNTIIEKYSKVTSKLVTMADREASDLCSSLSVRPPECFDSLGDQPFKEKPEYLDIQVKIEVEPDVYVADMLDMAASDREDGVLELTSSERVDAWTSDVTAAQEDSAFEPPRRRRRKCTERAKIITETDDEVPKKVKPKRIYKKRIRAYIHECPICQRMFNRTNHLKDHMKIHTDERPYPCKFCTKRFIQKINLKNHLMKHTGEKPFECKICGTSFIARSDFKRHMNTHNEERNFACDLCHRRFTQISYLKAHMNTHTSEKPFECHLCNRRFSQKPYLKNHLKRHSDRDKD